MEIDRLKDECDKCNKNYYLVDKTCHKLPSFCITLNSNKKCSECSTAYFLNGEVCSPINVGGCLEGSSAGVCTKCAEKFALVSGKCEAFTNPNCLEGTSKTVCTKCAQFYFNENNNTCTAYADSNCETGTSVSTCTKCKAGFILEPAGCHTLNDKNCLKGTSKSVCTECAPGYWLKSSDKSCVKIAIDNCTEAEDNGSGSEKCTTCKYSVALQEGYKVVANKCTDIRGCVFSDLDSTSGKCD